MQDCRGALGGRSPAGVLTPPRQPPAPGISRLLDLRLCYKGRKRLENIIVPLTFLRCLTEELRQEEENRVPVLAHRVTCSLRALTVENLPGGSAALPVTSSLNQLRPASSRFIPRALGRN